MKRFISVWLPTFASDRQNRQERRSAGSAEAMVSAPLAFSTELRGTRRIVAADRRARAAGVRPGLGVADARALLPHLRLMPWQPQQDARALAALAAWARRYTPWTRPDAQGDPPRPRHGGGAGLWLDISGCAHLFGGEAALLDDLLHRLEAQGFDARAALAGTPGAAWALARFGTSERRIVAVDGEEAALGNLPVAALRLADGQAAALARVGVRRIAELAALPRAPLGNRFGASLLLRLDQALGRRDEPLDPERPDRPFRALLTFAEPIARPEDMTEATRRLLDDLCDQLALAHRGARRLSLSLFRVDGSWARLAIGTSRPNRDVGHLARLFRERLDELDAGFGIEAMTLDAPVTDPLCARQSMLDGFDDDRAAESQALSQLVDRLAGRLGEDRVRRLRACESHIPERAAVAVSAFAKPAARHPNAGASPGDQASDQPRPLHLLAWPEPVEAVAPVPDDPPLMFRWRSCTHRVARAEGPERIGPEWWRLAPDSEDYPDDPAQHRIRDYYRVEDADGARFWLFREGLYRPDRPARWYLHGLFA